MNQVWNIARKELSDGLRNRWLLAISLLFAVLAVGIAWLGAAASGQLGFTSIPATIASLASLATFLMVSPGPTATAIWGSLGLNDDQLEAVAEGVTKRLLPGHFLESAAVANVILFQLSQGARGVFGQDWVVDNGYTVS